MEKLILNEKIDSEKNTTKSPNTTTPIYNRKTVEEISNAITKNPFYKHMLEQKSETKSKAYFETKTDPEL